MLVGITVLYVLATELMKIHFLWQNRMTIWILSLASVAVISLVSLVGLGTLSLNPSRVRKLATWLVSLTAGCSRKRASSRWV